MRYYRILITDPVTGATVREFTSLNTLGQTILGALNVEFDIPLFRMAEPAGAAYVKVWGVSIKDVSQAFDLNNKNIAVYGGMAKGLPLANPKQAGLLLQGTISQAFGNWQGVEQSLDFVVNVVGGSNDDPKNIVLNWVTGQTLGQAAAASLAVAFPTFTLVDKTSTSLILNQAEVGYYQTIAQFAAYVKEVSQHINPSATYQGVDVVIRNNQFIMYDGTSQANPAAVTFTDLIGQPTWVDFGIIQFKCVMRADLNVSDYVSLPPGQVTTSAQSYSQYRNGSIFTGTFQVDSVRHVGNFRQQDASSWVTVFDAHVP